jgi:hypothetical protein
MPQTRSSGFEARKEGTMSQNLAALDSDYVELAGSDPETSLAIGTLKELGKQGYLNLKDPSIELILGLLNARRKALFATSPQNSNVTTLGLQMPKSRKVIDASDSI